MAHDSGQNPSNGSARGFCLEPEQLDAMCQLAGCTGSLNALRRRALDETGLAVFRPYTGWEDFQTRNGLSDGLLDALMKAYPEGFEGLDTWVGLLVELTSEPQDEY